jgi:hypothetical protein
MADPTQQLQQMLNNAESSFGGLNSAGQQLASALLQAAKAGNTQTNAATATSQALSQLTARSQSVSAGISTMRGVFVDLANQSSSLVSDIYGAEKAFTSVIPTIDVLASTLTKISTGMGQLGSGFSLFGFNLGKGADAIATFANTGIEIVQNLLKFQLETAQKVADGFIASAKAGALFGGSITRMAQVAADARVPIQTLVKVITANADSLTKLGLGQEKGAAVVTAYTRKIFDSDSALRILYGSFEELSVGVAGYLASQEQLGISSTRNYEQTKAAAIDYLYRQKELTAITGKNADLLKKEEEARRSQLDYNLKLGRLGTTARANVEEGMAIAGKVFGSEGAKYAEEYFATGGKVYSKSALAYQAINQEAAGVIGGMIGAVDQSSAGFRTFTGSLLKDAAPALEAYARSNENLAEINRNANNPFITSMTSTSSAIMENLTFLKNATELYKTIEADQAKLRKGPLDAATKAYTDAQNELLVQQRLIDQTVMKNMESIGTTIKYLNQMQLGFISFQSSANDLLNKIITGKVTDTTAVKELIEKMLERIRNPPSITPPGPATRNNNEGPATGPNNPPPPPPPPPPPSPPPPPPTPPGPTPAEQRTAVLERDIERLTRELEAMRTNTPPNNRDADRTMADMLRELQEHTNLLQRIRDGQA